MAANAMTSSASSNIASGAPARITVANPTPSRTDQRHRPSRTMRRTARSIHGMAMNPSVMSRWLTWLKTGPANAKVAAPRTQASGGQREGAEEDVHADGDRREEDDFGGDPGGAVGHDDEQTDERIERPGVEIGHQRGAAEDVLVPERQLAVAAHRADQDMERVVLLQVVAGDQEVPVEEIGQHEGGGRNGDQHRIGPQGAKVCSESIHGRGAPSGRSWISALRRGVAGAGSNRAKASPSVWARPQSGRSERDSSGSGLTVRVMLLEVERHSTLGSSADRSNRSRWERAMARRSASSSSPSRNGNSPRSSSFVCAAR